MKEGNANLPGTGQTWRCRRKRGTPGATGLVAAQKGFVMNSINLVGNVGQTPVLRETNGGTPVANVTLATNRFYRDRDGQRQQATEWHRLVVWGEGAKNFAQIVGKGDQIAVRGRLEYKLREIAGEKVKDATIRVEEWTKLSPRKADTPAGETEPAAAAGDGAVDSGVFGDDDEIEF